MAFISKVHNFPGDFETPATTLPMWYDDISTTTSSGFLDKYHHIITMPSEYDVTTSWNSSIFPERFGVSEMVVPTSPISNGFSTSSCIPGDFRKLEQQQDDQYFCSTGGGGYVSNSWSTNYPTSTNHWETKSPKTSKEVEEPTLKIGKYSTEERKDKIMRYLKKRNQRNFNKTIKYECRKTLADKRIRVRGRFAKNNNDHHRHHLDDHQPCEDQVLPSINTAINISSEEEIQHLYSNSFLMKHDYDEEEEWLQEAMASLLY